MAMNCCLEFWWDNRLSTRHGLSFLWWNWFITSNLLYRDFIPKLIHYIFPIYLLDFTIRIFINKIFNMNITTSHSNKHLIPLFNLNMNPLLTKLVNSFTFTKKHDLHFVLISKHVDVHGQGHIYLIILPGDVGPEEIIFLVVFNVLQKFGNSFLI